MVARTRSSSLGSLPRAGNPRATASLVVGLAAVLAIPAGVVLSYYSTTVTLVESIASAGLAILLGLYAVVLARRAGEVTARTLGRAGGVATARIGRLLGLLGLCMGVTAGLAVGFYGLLSLFAKA